MFIFKLIFNVFNIIFKIILDNFDANKTLKSIMQK